MILAIDPHFVPHHTTEWERAGELVATLLATEDDKEAPGATGPSTLPLVSEGGREREVRHRETRRFGGLSATTR